MNDFISKADDLLQSFYNPTIGGYLIPPNAEGDILRLAWLEKRWKRGLLSKSKLEKIISRIEADHIGLLASRVITS